ncbi:protein Shroom4 isoform X3 [Tamandua tetradactyla]|uniref:protein Shroom4 isoform X3 n=1 Tax=Tamandua tetradactyla TaxID=48850 RepID=UPI00405392CC
MENRPGSFQYVPVQLQGGAPWGFTLKGGLEHCEPLTVSKIEDGGKAALSQKMRTGDELVNINGTPLYGSRQEALILIKGSFRILKLIVRRRNAPVSRPHSWHVAKLLEGCPEEAATTMHFPSEAFSLSWHSGCNPSDVCVQWCPLSRHCSTEKSSSIGSMESLEQPGQATYEAHLLPIDQNMYPNQRDSAYSSFSASSNASDCALSLRPEESASGDCIIQGSGPTKAPNSRPNVTETSGGGRRANGGHLTPNYQMSSRQQESHPSGPAMASRGPPQPPVRRDSLQASRAQLLNGEQHRAAESMDSLQQEKPSSETTLSPRNTNRFCCLKEQDQVTSEGHQNCDVSQPSDSCQQGSEHLVMESLAKADGSPKSCDKASIVDSNPLNTVSVDLAKTSSVGNPPHLTGPTGHRHSAPEQLLVSHLQHMHLDARGTKGMELPTGQDGHQWTLSPLHSCHTGRKSPCPPAGGTQDQPSKERKTRSMDDRRLGSGPQRPSSSPNREADGHSPERGFMDPNRASSDLAMQQTSASGSPVQQTRDSSSTTKVVDSTETTEQEDSEHKECIPMGGRRSGGTRGRSIQNRRKSERFATNLRNEIQRRKAQLQKSKGPLSQLCDAKEPVEETEEPPESLPLPASNSTPLSLCKKPPSPREKEFNKSMMLRARSSECLSQASESHESRTGLGGQVSSGQRTGHPSFGLNTWWKASDPSFSDPEKANAHCRVRGSQWRWSPENNLQPHVALTMEGSSNPGDKELKVSAAQAGEEAILLPFADRRKFFEESSKSLSTSHLPGLTNHSSKTFTQRPKPIDQNFHPMSSSYRDLRCHPMDQSYHSTDQPYHSMSPLQSETPTYPECFASKGLEQSMCHKPLHCGNFDYRRTCSYSCSVQGAVVHDPCIYCSGEICPALLKRNMMSNCYNCRCHHHQCIRCSACYHNPQHSTLKDGSLEPGNIWKPRKLTVQEFPGDKWKPITGNKKTNQSGRPETFMAEESKPKPTWNQSCYFPEEKFSFIGWGPEQQHHSAAGIGEPKAKVSAATLVKPLGATGSICFPCHSATVEEVGAIGDMSEAERRYPFSGRRPAPPQAVSEELMRDVVGHDKSLAGVLNPASNILTTAEVMGDLFAAEDLHWRGHLKQEWHRDRRNDESAQESNRVPLQEFQRFSPPQGAPGIPTSYSAYYNISVAKAELLNKLKDQPEMAEVGVGEEEVDHELAQKKIQLIESIGRKLSVLREAQRGLLEDINANSTLGEEVEANLKAICKSNEFEKYCLFIGDLDKVVNLLLSLSGRLARVENALNSIDSEANQEKLVLIEKKQQLTGQLADAKELKEHIDRREKLVFGMVSRYLPQDQLQDYQHFVKMKSALIIEQRELEEKIKLGEEQLRCLRESLLLGPSNF